jgi:hypothetical protein
MEIVKIGDGRIIVTSAMNQLVFREMNTNNGYYIGQNVNLQDVSYNKYSNHHVLPINNYTEL